jgi:hypothetical protein
MLYTDKATTKDLLNVYRVEALNALNKYQVATKALRDTMVIPKEFEQGDLVLVRTARTEAKGKLKLKWEGPYIVSHPVLEGKPNANHVRARINNSLTQ